MSTPTPAPPGEDRGVASTPLIIGLSVGGAALLLVVLIVLVVLVRRRKSPRAAVRHKQEGNATSPPVLAPSLDGWSRDKDKAAAAAAVAGSAKASEKCESLHDVAGGDRRPLTELSRGVEAKGSEHAQQDPDNDLYAAVGKHQSCHYGVVDEQAVDHYHAKIHPRTGAVVPCARHHEAHQHNRQNHHHEIVQDDISLVAGAPPKGSDDKTKHTHPDRKPIGKAPKHRPGPLTMPQPAELKAQCRHTFSGALSPDGENSKRDRAARSDCPAQLLSPPASASEGNLYFILDKEPDDESESPISPSRNQAQSVSRQGSEGGQGYEEFNCRAATASAPADVTSPESRDYYSVSDLAADLAKRTATYENTDFGSQSHLSTAEKHAQPVVRRQDSSCFDAGSALSPQSPLYYNASNLLKRSNSLGNSRNNEASDGSISTDSGISASLPDVTDNASCGQPGSFQYSMNNSTSDNSRISMYVNSQALTINADRREKLRGTHGPRTRGSSSAVPHTTKRGPKYHRETMDSSRTHKRPQTLPSPVTTNVQEPLYCVARPMDGQAVMMSPEVSPHPDEDVYGDFYFKGRSDVPCNTQNKARRGADDIYNHLHQEEGVESREVYSHTEREQRATHAVVQDDTYVNVPR